MYNLVKSFVRVIGKLVLADGRSRLNSNLGEDKREASRGPESGQRELLGESIQPDCVDGNYKFVSIFCKS